MSTPSPLSGDEHPRDADHWAQPVSKLTVSATPQGAINMNVDGRQIVGPLQGFGQLWQKTYRIRLRGLTLTPHQVMEEWKANFPKFQPPVNRFFPSLGGIQPGEVMFIDARVPAAPGTPEIIPIATGVMILYSDDLSFTVIAPQGHPESGWNTFSVFEEDGCIVAQVQSLDRANDPIYEIGFRFMGGARTQEATWHHVLNALAAHFGVTGQAEMSKICVDGKLQWSQARNVWHNAGVRSTFYTLAAPLRWVRDRVRPRDASRSADGGSSQQ